MSILETGWHLLILAWCLGAIFAEFAVSTALFREHPRPACLVAAASGLFVPSLWSAVLGLCGIDEPAVLLVLALVWGCIWTAMAPLLVFVLASLVERFRPCESHFGPPPDIEMPARSVVPPPDSDTPARSIVPPPVIDAQCCVCHENLALPATLFECGHAFVCAEDFPSAIAHDLQQCPFCRGKRLK